MTKTTHIPFSVCMSVYKNDNPKDVLTALRSISTAQTVRPTEIILVVDGHIPQELDKTISDFSKGCATLTLLRLEANQGHAVARQTAIETAACEWIAIMDSDDIARVDRFETQLDFIAAHPQVDILGGQIEEFIGTPDNIVGKREVPLHDNDIKQYLKARCPMNFVTIMAKKQVLENAGGIIDWYCEEDYYLWIRLALQNAVFANCPETLVDVRVGAEMYQRRGGWKYFKSERGIQRYMWKHHLISFPRYLYNVLGRFVVQVLMTNRVRSFVFQKLFRK